MQKNAIQNVSLQSDFLRKIGRIPEQMKCIDTAVGSRHSSRRAEREIGGPLHQWRNRIKTNATNYA